MKPFPFIVGFGRSGTTLLRALLDAHPQLAIPPESHFTVPMARRARRYRRGRGFDGERFTDDLFTLFGGRMARWGLSREAVAAELDASPPGDVAGALRAVYRAYAAAEGKGRFGDKTPIHILNLPLLADLFPEARFVHIIRDGRDATLSYLQQSWGPETVTEGAVRWKRAVRAGRRAGARLAPDRYLEVRYEGLVADAEASMRRVSAFVGLPFHPDMLLYHQRAERIIAQTDESHAGLRRPPVAGLRDWRRDMTPRDLATFETLAGDVLAELGYERAVRSLSVGRRLEGAARWLAFQTGRASRRVLKAAGGHGRDLRRRPVRSASDGGP